MAIEIKLPSLGENIDSGDVLSILVGEGDTVEAEQGVLEVETEKATLEVPSPQSGRIAKMHVAEGDTVTVGSVIFTLEPAEAEKPAARKEPPKAKKTTATKKPAELEQEEADAEAGKESAEQRADEPAIAAAKREAAQEEDEEPAGRAASPSRGKQAATAASRAAPKPQTPSPAPGAVHDVPGDGHAAAAAGPAVRRLARELGVDLRRVRGSGPSGRITRDDVQAFVREVTQKAAPSAAAGPAPPGEPAVDDYGPISRQKLSRMRQTIARNVTQSYATIPQLTNFDDADITELEKIRQESKADYAHSGIKLTSLPFLIKAVAASLRMHPAINASIDMENNQVIYKQYVHIGLAVDTEKGLVVPVLRDADQMTIPQIARRAAEMAEKARRGELAIEDMRGGTFTVSNLGSIGGSYSTPIINPPEAAILLAGRARMVPVLKGEKVVGRLMLPLSLTYDHRLIDGAAAARFLNDVKDYLSAPGRLLLAP